MEKPDSARAEAAGSLQHYISGTLGVPELRLICGDIIVANTL